MDVIREESGSAWSSQVELHHTVIKYIRIYLGKIRDISPTAFCVFMFFICKNTSVGQSFFMDSLT